MVGILGIVRDAKRRRSEKIGRGIASGDGWLKY